MIAILRRFRRSLRRGRDNAGFLVMVARLLWDAARGQARELWIGDSHAAHFNNGEWPCARLRRLPDGRFVWHLGPRLMWSIARDGFPRGVGVLARLLGIVGRPDRLAVVFALGEIDVRCHLAGRDGPLAFVSVYVEHGTQIAHAAKAKVAVFVVPTPPSDDYEDTPGFPIKGTLAERLAVFAALRTALAKATESNAGLLDCTSGLAGPDGAFRAELTIDGCHTNDTGRAIVRQRLDAVLADQ